MDALDGLQIDVIQTRERSLWGDQCFVYLICGDPQRRPRRSLRGSRLQQEELAVLLLSGVLRKAGPGELRKALEERAGEALERSGCELGRDLDPDEFELSTSCLLERLARAAADDGCEGFHEPPVAVPR